MTDPLRVFVVCRDIFRGEKKPGVPFLCLHFFGNVSAFVPQKFIDKFDDIQIGDVVYCDVYDFRVEGIKFIPRACIKRADYEFYHSKSGNVAGGGSGDGSKSAG